MSWVSEDYIDVFVCIKIFLSPSTENIAKVVKCIGKVHCFRIYQELLWPIQTIFKMLFRPVIIMVK